MSEPVVAEEGAVEVQKVYVGKYGMSTPSIYHTTSCTKHSNHWTELHAVTALPILEAMGMTKCKNCIREENRMTAQTALNALINKVQYLFDTDELTPPPGYDNLAIKLYGWRAGHKTPDIIIEYKYK